MCAAVSPTMSLYIGSMYASVKRETIIDVLGKKQDLGTIEKIDFKYFDGHTRDGTTLSLKRVFVHFEAFTSDGFDFLDEIDEIGHVDIDVGNSYWRVKKSNSPRPDPKNKTVVTKKTTGKKTTKKTNGNIVSMLKAQMKQMQAQLDALTKSETVSTETTEIIDQIKEAEAKAQAETDALEGLIGIAETETPRRKRTIKDAQMEAEAHEE
jgi:hypothetical protein